MRREDKEREVLHVRQTSKNTVNSFGGLGTRLEILLLQQFPDGSLHKEAFSDWGGVLRPKASDISSQRVADHHSGPHILMVPTDSEASLGTVFPIILAISRIVILGSLFWNTLKEEDQRGGSSFQTQKRIFLSKNVKEQHHMVPSGVYLHYQGPMFPVPRTQGS